MDHIQAFQVAALKCGFVDMDECGRGTILWFKRAAIRATPEALQRLCVDTITDSATAYWTNAQGKITSKTFRSVAALQRWMSGNTSVEPLNTVVSDSSSPEVLPSSLPISLAAGAGKRAS